MNLVFFDIECAGVYKTMAKICAFGYVVCDENFNILAKEDILINPKGAFHLTDSKGEKGLVLPYKYEDFKKYPSFPSVYPKIRELLEDKNNLVAGHATYNDVNYLNLETRRFSLPSFSFSFSDTQMIYMTLTGGYSRQYGLEYITKDLNVEFTPHRAADDAYATMKVAEAMCRSRDCGFEELERSLAIKHGKIEKYCIQKPVSVGYSAYAEKCRRDKEERSRIRREFYTYLSRKKRRPAGSLHGRVFNFSRAIEDDISHSVGLIDRIYELGGEYTQKLAHCNVYVAEEDDCSTRTRNARLKEGLEILLPAQLKELLV